MIAEGVEANFAPGFSVQGRDVVDGQEIALGAIAASFDVQDLYPGAGCVPSGCAWIQKKFWISGEVDCFWGPDAGELVVAVAGVDAAPAVDDDVGAEFADDADHVFHDGVAPDFFGFFGSFGEAEILGAGEIEFDAVAAGGGEKFLGADEAELRGLFGAERVLPSFAAGDREKGDVGVEPTGKIGEDGPAFVIGMRGDVEDARGDTGGVDGFDGFGEAGAGAGSGRELAVCRGGEECGCE